MSAIREIKALKPMLDYSDNFLYKTRFFIGVMLMITGLLMLPIFVSLVLPNPKVQAANNPSSSFDSTMEDSPNVITSGMFGAADGLSKTANSTERAISSGVNSVADSIVGASTNTGKFIANGVGSGATFTVRGIGNSALFVAHGIGGSVGFVAHTTGGIFGTITSTKAPTVSSVIRPADEAKVEVINKNGPPLPESPALPAQQNAVAQQPQPQPVVDQSAQWPIHGTITTEFGASDWPYQSRHSGIDISDGKYSGITPIHPFKPGKVIQVIHSSVSLGNHIIVDNGGGVTSVYGHMYKTNVVAGQQVDKNSVLGWEGTTGASTGPHLHFEIYLNGALQNPHNYVPGRP
jgi:murein DD-endopeptidase MepM/ murein hydrolase activator NlpD